MSFSNLVPKLVVLGPRDKDCPRLLAIERCRSILHGLLNDLLELGVAESGLVGKIVVASSGLK